MSRLYLKLTNVYKSTIAFNFPYLLVSYLFASVFTYIYYLSNTKSRFSNWSLSSLW